MELTFQTQCLSARPPVPSDAPAIAAYFQDKELAWNLARAPWPYALEDAQNWIMAAADAAAEGKEYAFVLHHKEYGLIGSAGMVHIKGDIWEVGYWVAKPYWGQGFVTEAARGLMDWAKDTHGVTRFISGHIEDNSASGAVLRKLGFEAVGTHRMHVRARNQEITGVRYVYGGAPAEVALEVPDYSGGHG